MSRCCICECRRCVVYSDVIGTNCSMTQNSVYGSIGTFTTASRSATDYHHPDLTFPVRRNDRYSLLADKYSSHAHAGTNAHARNKDLATRLLTDIEAGGNLSRASCTSG